MGVYFGVLISIKLVASSGHAFGNRSIPEYLGDRYKSDGVRLLVSVFSLVLFFYIAGQLVSGLVMFETMLGLDPMWALIITTVVLLIYVVLGGAHADILTDGVQGFMMLLVALLTIFVFVFGVGVDGGMSGIFKNIGQQDEDLVGLLNTSTPISTRGGQSLPFCWHIFRWAYCHTLATSCGRLRTTTTVIVSSNWHLALD
tara:strand:- start:2190 stop:2789 length:600 start_codon:yes stop_codon:yes gene_type:complete